MTCLPGAITSAVILVVTTALVVLLPWDRLPAWCDVAVPLLYTVSVLPLAQAAGGTYSGILVIVLIPIIWTALCHRPWESACVSAAALAVLLTVSLMPDMARPAVLTRRLIFWARRINRVVEDLDECITLLRQSIFDPAHGTPARGLRRSILDVSCELTPWLGVAPEVILEGPLDTVVPPRAARQLLGMPREGLARSGACAHAAQMAVAVAADHEAVTLTITDDGTRWAARSAGDGPTLPALRARAHELGGTVATEYAATGQTQLIWRAPLRTLPRGAPSRSPGPRTRRR